MEKTCKILFKTSGDDANVKYYYKRVSFFTIKFLHMQHCCSYCRIKLKFYNDFLFAEK